MEIRHECYRCGETVNAKVTKTRFKGGKEHNRVNCTKCGKYIKFISESELSGMVRLESNGKVFFPPKEGGYTESEITLGELNFKLDLIIDHLGIKNG